MSAVCVTILILRHGQSEWNSIRRWQGTADSPLTALGRAQARTTGRLLADLGLTFASVWSSDLRRSSETADIIAGVLGLGAPTLDPRLREAHAGEWQGLTPDQIEVGWPGWLESHRRPPSFEPYPGVVSRSEQALHDVSSHAAAGAPPSALVVAHSGVIRSMIRHLGRPDGRIPNLGGVWLSASVIGGRSELALGDLFDPSGIVVSGVDAPGEDPGE